MSKAIKNIISEYMKMLLAVVATTAYSHDEFFVELLLYLLGLGGQIRVRVVDCAIVFMDIRN